ncbi:sialate O-acetylesterase [Pedobacter alluvionis]|uniref:Sialate O-acetylesterase n=1 Tax=Pedobacter alluvionis TaxID=475253 RepID=A0A497Y8Q9_9SPHI|nr:sialate O-acetylesterase [Pedobacter alluvionis]RLJ79575.1 sialate O-acetylesterase [Pedobacter alluvionis]TFB30911.1 sialate O-acetylesterase [Pedobacter alluvionis]
MKTKLILCCFTWLLVFSFSVSGKVTLPQLVSSHMVLQRETPLTIWGWAAAKEKITISFSGKTYKAITDEQGSWSVKMNKMKAGGPYKMIVRGENTITLDDIMLGDVWFCSGQSNMALPMERLKEAYPQVIEKDHFPLIRNFFVPTKSNLSGESIDLPPGKWVPATGAGILSFGGTSYFFAKTLFQKYNIPIGIINSSVGGTPIEAWMSRDAFLTNPAQTKKINNFRDSAFMANYQKRLKEKNLERPTTVPVVDEGLSGPVKWIDPDFNASNWRKFWMPGYWADQGLRNFNGIFYFRKELQIPAEMSGQQAKLYLGRIIDADSVFLNGKFIGNTTYQYPPRRYVIPAGLLKSGKNILIVKVVSSSGKGGFVPDKNYSLLTPEKKIDLRGEWTFEVGYAQPRQNQAFRGEAEMPLVAQNEPTGLFNTMVSPAVQFAIKGFVWYQGESNTGDPKAYAELLPALIKDWRNKWKQGDLPFIYAQLPNFMEAGYLPEESIWAEFRQSQLQALSVPNTGMAVAIDAGEWNDIHPLDKKDVGERLALWASHLAYHDQEIIYSGPIYKSNHLSGSEVTINFEHTKPGLMIKGSDKLIGFVIAGEDKVFYWAQARIVGDAVVLSSPLVLKPAFIRYAWADNPDRANLYNKANLPASPFEAEVDHSR